VAKIMFCKAEHAALTGQTDWSSLDLGGQIVPTMCFMSGIAKKG